MLATKTLSRGFVLSQSTFHLVFVFLHLFLLQLTELHYIRLLPRCHSCRCSSPTRRMSVCSPSASTLFIRKCQRAAIIVDGRAGGDADGSPRYPSPRLASRWCISRRPNRTSAPRNRDHRTHFAVIVFTSLVPPSTPASEWMDRTKSDQTAASAGLPRRLRPACTTSIIATYSQQFRRLSLPSLWDYSSMKRNKVSPLRDVTLLARRAVLQWNYN